MKTLSIIVSAVMLSGCAAASATLRNATSVWCSYAESEQVKKMEGAAMGQLKDGTDKAKLQHALELVGSGTEQACEIVKGWQNGAS
jgi:hypothetical protein